MIYFQADNYFGRLIINRCNEMGIETMTDLARKIGVSKNYVAILVRGQRRPSVKTLASLSEVLDIDARDLIAALTVLQKQVAKA